MSTVPEVLAALAVLGQATLPGHQVINGTLGSVTVTDGPLLLIGDEDFEIKREPDSLAGVTATEEYVVPCSVVADVPGADQSVADAQAYADSEAMEAAIFGNPHLGLSAGFSLHATIVATQTFRRLADQNGRHALVRFGVHIFATTN
jgi:hypothetical protein